MGSLFHKIGGKPAVSEVVEVFYEKILADPTLAVFFKDVSTDQIKKHQRYFLTTILGGPTLYAGTLRRVHETSVKGGLCAHHFDKTIGYLAEALAEVGVTGELADEILGVARSYKHDVTNSRSKLWRTCIQFLNAFLAINVLGWLLPLLSPIATPPAQFLLVAAFGAASVLLFCSPEREFAQPKNLIGGMLISSIIGVTSAQLFGHAPIFAAALAVAAAIAAMYLTDTIHPPGGAAAMIPVLGPAEIKALGYGYVLCPILLGSLILLGLAVFLNRFVAREEYPVRRKFAAEL